MKRLLEFSQPYIVRELEDARHALKTAINIGYEEKYIKSIVLDYMNNENNYNSVVIKFDAIAIIINSEFPEYKDYLNKYLILL